MSLLQLSGFISYKMSIGKLYCRGVELTTTLKSRLQGSWGYLSTYILKVG